MVLNKNFLKDIQSSKYFELLPDFKKQKTQAFGTLAFTLIALSFFGLFAISPTLSTIAELNKQLDDNQFIEKSLEQKIANLSTLQRQYGSIEPDLPILYSAVPETPIAPTFMAQLQAIGQQSNVSILRVHTFQVELVNTQNTKTALQTPQSAATFSFAINAQGPNKDVETFLKELAQFDRIISIDTLSLSKGSPDNPSTQIDIRGKAYFK